MDEFIIAVFKSRDQSMRFSGELKRIGYRNSIINTPKGIISGCGISVRFQSFLMKEAEQIIRRGGYNSFAGFYSQRA